MSDIVRTTVPQEQGHGGPPKRRGRTVAAVVAGAVVLVVAVAVGGYYLFSGADGGPDRGTGRSVGSAEKSKWAAVTPVWVSEQTGLRVPAEATERRAAYEVTSRFGTGLLVFTLPKARTDTYLDALRPKGAEWVPNDSPLTNGDVGHAFRHLGLPEPETVRDGMVSGGVCPGDTEDPAGAALNRCVDLYAHRCTADRTRIYVRAHFEPGISPLPVTPS